MNYKIIADSSADVDQAFLASYPVTIVPFRLNLEGVEYVDDDQLDVDDFVSKMKASSVLPKSSCPSPNDFYKHFEGDEEEIFIITISSKLSGTYNSAVMARNMYVEEFGEKAKKIHVVDSLGAAAGETLMVQKIHEMKKNGLSFENVVEKITAFTKDLTVMFISESLDNLIKNGRISKWKGMIASTLKIHPIMGSNGEGEIKLYEKVRQANKAYQRMIELMTEEIMGKGKTVLAITHVNNDKRATQIQEAFAELIPDMEIIKVKCRGLSSLYADQAGIIVAF